MTRALRYYRVSRGLDKFKGHEAPFAEIICDLCDLALPEASEIHSRRFVCCTCIDVDLCAPCMDEYNAHGRSLGTDAYEVCQGHEFLEVPHRSWGWVDDEKVNPRGETEREFLNRLAREYGRLTAYKNDSIAEGG